MIIAALKFPVKTFTNFNYSKIRQIYVKTQIKFSITSPHGLIYISKLKGTVQAIGVTGSICSAQLEYLTGCCKGYHCIVTLAFVTVQKNTTCCQPQARLKPKRCLGGIIFTLNNT